MGVEVPEEKLAGFVFFTTFGYATVIVDIILPAVLGLILIGISRVHGRRFGRICNNRIDQDYWQNYVDYHRCAAKRGEEYEPCQFFFRNFNTLCPLGWVEKWNDQRENGSFPAKLD